MVKNRLLNKAVAIVFSLALLLASVICSYSVLGEFASAAENKVYFSAEKYSANNSGLIYAEIIAEGASGQVVTVSYHTESATAIEGIDYNAVNNVVQIKIGSDGKGKYTISIQAKGGFEDRQKFSIKSGDEIYGRYFDIMIDKALNAVVSKPLCRCYLPYNNIVDGTVGVKQSDGETGYITDYKTMQSIYHGGDGSIDGKSTWKTWKNGVSFDNDTTRRWLNTYVNTGLASAYSSYLIKEISFAKWYSATDIYVLAGNDLFREKYSEVKHNIPGCYLYLGFEPDYSIWSGASADKINGRAMYLVSNGKNPNDEDGDYIDVNSADVSPDHRHVYWIQDKDAWFAKKNALTDSAFYKTEPHNGKIDMSMVVWNKNKEVDIMFKNAWFLMTLIDETCPTVVGQYVDDSRIAIDGKLRFCIRFSEPVVSTKKKSIEVKFNNSATPYYANYVLGNYTDTLVYELTPPAINIKMATYQLPTDDIGDMAYNLDAYKVIRNNKVQNTDKDRILTMINGNINNVTPRLAIDIPSSLNYKNNYNLMLSINDNGNVDITRGTIYYEWSKEESRNNRYDAFSYRYSRALYDEDMGSINVSLVKDESEGIDSGKYYLHALAVGRYGLTNTMTYGPYMLDGDPPIIVQQPLPQNELKTKTYRFTNDKVGGAGIVNVKINTKYKVGDETIENSQALMTDGVCVKGFTVKDETYEYSSNINGEDLDLDGQPDMPLDEFILGLMKNNPRLNLSVSFEAQDSAGNVATTNWINVVYDKRDTFKVTSEFPSDKGYLEITDITTSYPAYDISSVSREEGVGIMITISEADKTQIVDGTYFRVFVGEKEYSSGEDPYTVVIGDLYPGYYQIIPNIYGVVEESEVDLVANPVQFYLTDGKKDDTTNKLKSEGNFLLAGSVFRIDGARYYFLDREDKVSSHLYGAKYDNEQSRYDGGSSSPAFSNVNEAKKYVRYMEYLDLNLITLTANQASMLNSSVGTTTYTKANGETRTAQEGQLWIRYKKKSWTTSSNAYGWAYYYYGESGGSEARIDLSRLSSNLIDAINGVVNHIVSAGSAVDLVTESDLNSRSGEPYLSLSQIHCEIETTETSKNGSAYVNPPSYDGDSAIYQNTVFVNGVEYPLATNMPLSVGDGTSLYYRYYESSVWRPMIATDGQLLSSALNENASGIYTIREYDENGVSEFDIYFDKTTPTLTVIINEEKYVLDGTVLNYSGNTAYISAMGDEIDPYGYVAIYSYPTRSLRAVIRKADFSEYDLGNGNFYLQVGDRSGNIITYTLLLSATQLEVKIDESESQSGIRVRILNRDDDEIYSYEIYLNEELIDSEYSESKIFKTPGVYRIVVVDIYGNTVTETYEYDFPSPKITWYYLNSMGGYSKYDPDNIVNMIISQDESNPRLSNVYTSTRVRLTFDLEYGDSEIKFEMLDIPQGSYTYSDATGIMTINTDASWRLRVWFEEFPQNDRTYFCSIDAAAPEYDATFVGVDYTPNTLIDDAQFLSAYEEGDIISLQSLEIREGEIKTLSFADGSVISGNHITVSLFDPSGIRTYSVTRNGQPMSLSMNEDGQLLISNYGSYVVTATDNLGNVSTFRFTNVKEAVATAKVDGEEIGEEIAYGKGELVVTSEYASTVTMLIKSGNSSDTYVFDYDGKTLTCGQYVLRIDEETENNSKYAEIDRSNGVEMEINDETRVGKWYGVINQTSYTVSVMKDEGGKLNYKIATIGEEIIEAQVYVSVGNNKRPCLYSVALSSKEPKIVLLTNNQPAEVIEGLSYIYVAGVLTIGEIDEDVNEIKAGYSLSAAQPELRTIYKDGEFTEEFEGTEEGYYTIRVTNVFHSEKIYLVQKIKSFSSLVTVTYFDGMKKEYLTNPSVIYSNYKIDLKVFSNNVYFEVNDIEYEGYAVGGTTSLQLDRMGEYDVRIVASNGVFEHFHFEIDTEPTFVFNDEWLTGYNEKAILKEQGYTNKPLDIVLKEGVEYIDIENGDEREVLYDNLSEEPFTDGQFAQAVGKKGSGTYVVNFRNKFGDLATKTIRIKTEPLLTLSRKTIARQNEWEAYSVEKAREGFYSNYVLRFATESINYDFRINGNEVNLDEPKTIELDRTSGNGSFEYDVSFLDEYGNFISFKAVLMRADVTIDTSEMTEIEINGKIYTKDNVVVNFDGAYFAEVSIDGDEPISYTSGHAFYGDGEYIFTVGDIAGNVREYTIIHKSVNHYTLLDASTDQPIVTGGVVNNSSVVFEASDDSYVGVVVRNGEAVESMNTKSFGATGHWELLVLDPLGNASYAEFYVINNSLGSFEYTAPYDYAISEVWLTNKKGVVSQVDTDGNSIDLEENGDYVIGVTGIGILSSFRFTVTIDDTPPSINLVGVENGGVTANDVSIKAFKSGDNVKIYKDGVLVDDIDVSLSSNIPDIVTGGDYRIVVTNIQGVSTEYTFTRKKIANAATSIFIIIVLSMFAVGITIGLLYHTKLRTDA